MSPVPAGDAAGGGRALVPGLDYVVERGLVVFTARYLLARGTCCGSGCRHCPYDAQGRPRPDAVAAVAAQERAPRDPRA